MPPGFLSGLAEAELEHAVLRCGATLRALHKGSLLITGGTGFFGRWLVSSLIHANRTRSLGLTIHLVSRSPAAFASATPEIATDENVRLIEGDVRRFSYAGLRCSHVIHAAADTSVAADNAPLELIDTIVSGARHVLEAAAASGAQEALLVSSGAVYGGQGDVEQVMESSRLACDPLDRRSAYGEAKRMAELISAIYGESAGMRTRIARCFAFVGPLLPLDAHFAIGNFIGDAVAGRNIEIKGDGSPLRSYLHMADLVAWLIRALVLGKPGGAYNIGSDEGLSLKEIALLVKENVPEAGEVIVRGVPQPGGFRSRYVPSISKARAELAADVWIKLPSAIRSTAEWARKH
ncbi:NAD(P)-dependent oxidoreductase [Terrarubrum flagellatum]|uniref:NAD-dependent epimerase/dehydratase family protein n=1 Tax=Terrirubrum flagellatum TaxID=2895980 RepID=UPI0031456985